MKLSLSVRIVEAPCKTKLFVPFEEVEPMLAVLAEIGQPNFGLIYEPANLLLNGQSYGLDTLQMLKPHLMNVYVQNHRLNSDGADALSTYCRGTVRFDHLAPWSP